MLKIVEAKFPGALSSSASTGDFLILLLVTKSRLRIRYEFGAVGGAVNQS